MGQSLDLGRFCVVTLRNIARSALTANIFSLRFSHTILFGWERFR